MWRRLVRPDLAEARARGNAVDRPGKRVDTCGAREDPERMGALPRPDVTPGPHRELVDALHTLHHRAGWPSLRRLAVKTGVSHTTVSKTFSSESLPSWGTLELLVEAMEGDVSGFHELWLSASTPADAPDRPALRIAGRRDELLSVRRHMDSGTGPLLVTGEAGIGKTALVTAAAAGARTFVATGACRPLSTEVPLLPMTDLLRQVRRAHPTWFDEALGACPTYVRGAVSAILPELGSEEAPQVSEAWARQRLFNAVEALLAALRSSRSLALVVEDAHWADATTLDVLELLGSHACPLVVTVRTDDPDVDERFADWLTRVRRLPDVATLALVPLTLAETAEQLALLRGHDPEPDDAARVFARSLGQPLFTEQLALHPDDRPLPDLLADLLARRLRNLSAGAWIVARSLGISDRPVSAEQLAQITGSDPLAGLRELDAQGLVAPTVDGDEVGLRHPLVADAIRQHLVAGEAHEVHRRVATVLAAAADPPAAEIAQHWSAAGDLDHELHWRIAAARAASTAYAVEAAATQWQRVLALWPAGLDEAGDPPLTHAGMYVEAIGAVKRLDFAAAVPLLGKALEVAEEAAPEHAAAILLRAGYMRGRLGEADAGLDLHARAVALYADLPPCREHVDALHALAGCFEGAGRFRESAELGVRALAQARRLNIPSVLKEALAEHAWSQGLAGDTAGARASVDEMTAIVLDPPDPYCEMEVAVSVTDMLLMTGAPADELVDVARAALTAADAWGLHQWEDAILRCNVAEALVAQGEPNRAWDLVAPFTEGDPVHERWPLHELRAVLELLKGHTGEAQRHIAAVAEGPVPRLGLAFRLGYNASAATIELWSGQPAAALDRALPVLGSGQETEEPAMLGPLLVLAARAAADLRDRARGEQLRDLHRRLTGDPFAPHPQLVTPAALGATWAAELARLEGYETVDVWVASAAAWDRLTRPYDAAYSRWRGAQVAQATAQGTVTGRLLKRAALDARGHVPLAEAIRRTTEHGPDPEKPALAVPHGLTP